MKKIMFGMLLFIFSSRYDWFLGQKSGNGRR